MTTAEMDDQDFENEDNRGLSCTLDMFKEYEEVQKMIMNIHIDSKKVLTAEKKFEDFKTTVDQYQEQPHLLDPHLEKLLHLLVTLIRNPNSSKEELALAYKYLWLIVKVRGYKYITKKMPHEVKDLIPVLKLLEEQGHGDDFYGSYVLLMWLSIILYMPFNIARFDATVQKKETGEATPITVIERILVVVKMYLQTPHSSREMAAYLASRFVTRPDLRDQYLPEMINYCFKVLRKTGVESRQSLFHKIGVLRTLGLIFKNGKREELLPYSSDVLSRFTESQILMREDVPLRKFSMKLIQRIGLAFLKPRLASWRYQRGSRSLAMNMSNTKCQQTKEASSTDDENEEVNPCIEEVVDILLQGLKGQDTVVRWSAAKGIGRVTSRLPRVLADDVVGAILEMFTSRESDKAWHGGCLALAELARRGLFLPERLSEVLPILEKALVYDELRGQNSVGSNIRDAACYLSWAFARAYHPSQMAPFVHKLATGLLIVSLFDREIPCRRAGSAAFQEHVGRQGTFPHGIDILTAVDYFAVGNRANAFLSLSVHVCRHEAYTIFLIDHLVERKMGHWDSAIRDLTAKALANLTQFAPEHMAQTVLPSLLKSCTGSVLIVRHGALLASGYVILALAEVAKLREHNLDVFIDESIVQTVCNIVRDLDDRKLYRGMGGEYMRQATSVLIGKCSLAAFPIGNHPEVLERWHSLLEDCLIYVDENLRLAALDSLPAIWGQYFLAPSEAEWREKLVRKYVKGLQNDIENHSIGYAAALGCLPNSFLEGKFDVVLRALLDATKLTPTTTFWAKTRKEAINSMVKLTNIVGVEPNGKAENCYCLANVTPLYEGLLAAMDDYTMDRRGDIGAWVREAAMQALQAITSSIIATDASMLQEHIVRRMMQQVCQQAVERIDRTRKVAGTTLQHFLYGMLDIPHIPNREELLQIFDKDWCKECNWASERETFEKFVQILDLDTYRTRTLLGLTYSLGGVSANLSRYTCEALQTYLNNRLESPDLLKEFMVSILDLFNTHQRHERITQPLIKSLGELFSSCNALDKTLEGELLPRLLTCLRRECINCTDFYKLSAAVPTYCELLRIESPSTHAILVQLSIFLGYQYPKVRAITATSFLTALQEYSDRAIIPEEVLDEVCDLLEDTPWMSSIEEARQQRNKICLLIGVPPPQQKPKT